MYFSFTMKIDINSLISASEYIKYLSISSPVDFNHLFLDKESYSFFDSFKYFDVETSELDNNYFDYFKFRFILIGTLIMWTLLIKWIHNHKQFIHKFYPRT